MSNTLGTGVNLPIDYTSRDYLSIRANLINAITSYLPEWTDTSVNDFGIALLELFAYTGDNFNYYIDRMANEAFLATAQQRQSVLNVAYLIDYAPADATASVAALTIGVRANTQAFIIPSGTQFATQGTSSAGPIIFETTNDYTISSNLTTSTVNATQATENAVLVPILVTQGITVANEAVGASSGLPSQVFTLFNTGVIGNSVIISVNEGNGFQIWPELPNLLEAGPADAVWSSGTDANGVVYINFGNGANGRIPDDRSAIQATYRVGGGAATNVAAGSITVCLSSNSLPGIATVTNAAAAAGGADPETIAQIQANAPQTLTALSRCVSLADYASVALTLPSVGKASAASSNSHSVQLYVHPNGGPYATLTLVSLVSNPVTGLGQALTNAGGIGWLDTAKPAGTTVTVLPPQYDGTAGYVPIYITTNVQVLPTFDALQVQQNVMSALVTLFNFTSMAFGQLITQSSVWHTIEEVAGVDWHILQELRRGDQAALTIGNIQCAPYEIPSLIAPLLTAPNVTVNTSGGL